MDSENSKDKKINQNEGSKRIEENVNIKNDNEIPKFDEFINLTYEEFGANCISFISKFFTNNLYLCSLKIYSKEKFNVEIKVKKKLSDFERLYKLINSKYSKMNLQPFPNYLFTKDEEYMNYFDNLLNDIIRMAKENEEMKIIFLKFLYDFFIEDKEKEISNIKGDIISDMFSKENSTVLKTPKASKFKINFNNIINSYKKENKKVKDKDIEDLKKKENDNMKVIENQKNEKKNSKDFDAEILNGMNVIENEWENISIKLTDEEKFNGYLRINNQCLFIYKIKPEDNIEQYFDYMIPLYNLNVDIRKNKYGNDITKSLLYSKSITSKEIYDLYNSDPRIINMKLSEINIYIEITMYHSYSQFFINIIFEKENTVTQLKNFVEFIENNSFILFQNEISHFPYIKQIDEKYINIYGLLSINIDSLQISHFSDECFIQITSFPYIFNTKKIQNGDNIEDNIYNINQQFIIPIHNRFGKIKFEIYQDVFKGVLIKSKEHEIIYEAHIEITQILNQFNKNPNNFHLIFKSLVKDPIKKKKNSLLSIIEEDGDNTKPFRTNILLTIKDYSSPFVLLEKNKNKFILEDVEAGDYNLGVKILFKRLRKIFYLFDELNSFYKSIYQFKYPVFSFLSMFFIFMNLYFIETKFIVKLIIIILLIILISKSHIYKIYLESYVNKYIFSYKNSYDLKSKIISTKTEIEDKDVQNPDYLIEKDEINFIADIIDPLTNYNKYKLKYFGFIIKITKFVASVEKIKNLFLWTDPKLTMYFFILLILSYLILYKVDFKYLIILSLSKKFFVGFFYYRNKYKNNKEIARILLEHAVQNWRDFNNKIENNNFQRIERKIDLSTIRVYDSRFKDIIVDIFDKNSNAIISPTIFNIINSLKDMQNEIGKCERILKIRKISPLYRYVKNNDKILKNEIEIEDIFYYFIQNIKSDFYILRNKEDIKGNINEIKNDEANRYLSLSSENFVSKNKNNNENLEKKKNDN